MRQARAYLDIVQDFYSIFEARPKQHAWIVQGPSFDAALINIQDYCEKASTTLKNWAVKSLL